MKSAKMSTILLLALGLASVSLVAEDTSDMLMVRTVGASSVGKGMIYVIGGRPP